MFCQSIKVQKRILSEASLLVTDRDSRSMSSGFDMASGRMRGMAATHVLNRSILGFLSPLFEREGKTFSISDHEITSTIQHEQMLTGNHARDHVLWFFVEHLDTGEHHAAAHLLVQVSQDVVQGLSHLGVVQGHTWRGEKTEIQRQHS